MLKAILTCQETLDDTRFDCSHLNIIVVVDVVFVLILNHNANEKMQFVIFLKKNDF